LRHWNILAENYEISFVNYIIFVPKKQPKKIKLLKLGTTNKRFCGLKKRNIAKILLIE